jgi:nitroimidazol reductase NimA-like FMN-containing flavoprotein (pyridoxamine 5'-phosphate oxidase superfamily)
MEFDRNGLEVLGRAECLRLLGTATLGRVAVTADALPVILPVNFLVADDQIVIRTGRGTKLDAATRNAVVAFEVDDIDPMYHTGWSVLVTGVARDLTAHPELLELPHLPARWAPEQSADGRLVAISLDLVSGRRITTEDRVHSGSLT